MTREQWSDRIGGTLTVQEKKILGKNQNYRIARPQGIILPNLVQIGSIVEENKHGYVYVAGWVDGHNGPVMRFICTAWKYAETCNNCQVNAFAGLFNLSSWI